MMAEKVFKEKGTTRFYHPSLVLFALPRLQQCDSPFLKTATARARRTEDGRSRPVRKTAGRGDRPFEIRHPAAEFRELRSAQRL